jgi:hypothetical protein
MNPAFGDVCVEAAAPVRIYDAPAGGIRILFRQKDGVIATYTKNKDAVAGVRIYDCADKTVLFDAEQAAGTGAVLGDCGLTSLVHFGDYDHCAFATFILTEDYIRRSDLKIIGYKGEEPVYSLGWNLPESDLISSKIKMNHPPGRFGYYNRRLFKGGVDVSLVIRSSRPLVNRHTHRSERTRLAETRHADINSKLLSAA